MRSPFPKASRHWRESSSRSSPRDASTRRGSAISPARSHEPEDDVRQALRKHVTQGACIRSCTISSTIATHRRTRQLWLHELAQEHGTVEAAQFRDAIGLGRKRAIQILSFSIALATLAACRRLRTCCAPDSGWRSRVTPRSGWLTLHGGRHSHPVVRLGFKPSGGVSRFLVGSTPAAFRQFSEVGFA